MSDAAVLQPATDRYLSAEEAKHLRVGALVKLGDGFGEPQVHRCVEIMPDGRRRFVLDEDEG